MYNFTGGILNIVHCQLYIINYIIPFLDGFVNRFHINIKIFAKNKSFSNFSEMLLKSFGQCVIIYSVCNMVERVRPLSGLKARGEI